MILTGFGGNVVRAALPMLLLLGPLVVVLDRVEAAGELTLFVLAGAALIPLSWLGSIAGNLLLVLGFTLLFGQSGAVDRRSAYISLGLVGFVTLVVLVVAAAGFHGDPDRRSLAELSLPLAALLLVVPSP
ncbi:MAG TPA: hypothetical protein VEL10_09775 [Gaiellaceae bacterium]|nr:hypothetical protein [Gaiellaceae bacterium]